MSRSDDTIADNRAQIGTKNRDTLGMIRRMVVTVTSGPFWQAVGLLLLDGATKETLPTEVFPGIGFFARPAPGANAEAIVVHAGGRSNPAIVATRDEATRKKMASIGQDETAAFNTKCGVYWKKDGTIEARSAAGTAVKLPTMADYEALRAAFNAHVHATAGTGAPSTPTPVPSVIPVATPTGTVVLKAE